MATAYDLKNLENLFSELSDQSDRAIMIVGPSIMEHAIERAIISRLRPAETGPEIRALFSDTEGILGTFSQKIWAAYFLEIIGPSARQDLHLIRKIRDVAAHDLGELSFDDPDLTRKCRALKLAGSATTHLPEPPDARTRFLLTVQFFTANILLRAGDNIAEITENSNALAASLDQ